MNTARTPRVAKDQRSVWTQIETAIHDARPRNPKIAFKQDSDSRDQVVFLNDKYADDKLDMTKDEMESMARSHAMYVKTIRDIELGYDKGSRGIVTTAADEHLGEILILLKMLRRTGCKLPAEVWLYTDNEKLPEICTLMPALNAQCKNIAAVIGHNNPELDSNRYLNKLFALILSAFEDALFIDADNLPMMDPTSWFDMEPYKSHSMVAWPDFWPSTISLRHAVVTGTTLAPINHTVESGQLMVSRTSHKDALLLALYYNYYGNDYYYPLESQGAVGSGDKETFLNAAQALNVSWYLVNQGIRAIGLWDGDSFRSPCMAQADPHQDYINYLYLQSFPTKTDAVTTPPIAFLHHNMLKLIPENTFGGQGHDEWTRRPSTGEYARMWGSKTQTEGNFGGQDMEKILWEVFREVSCGLKELGMLGKKEGEIKDACQLVNVYISEVFGEEHDYS